MMQAYIDELYNGQWEAEAYLAKLKDHDIMVQETLYGFFTYKLWGDAVLLYDMFILPAFRKQKKAWDLFNAVLKLGRSKGKTVVLTFSDKANLKPENGLGSIKAASFKKAFDTENLEVFMRGL